MTTNFTNVCTKLNIDVIQHILSYNDDMRILKIKMNQQNIKYLFESSRDIYHYLWCMKAFLKFPNKKTERIYVDILELLSNKNYTMKEIKNHILSLPSYHDYLESQDWFEYLAYSHECSHDDIITYLLCMKGYLEFSNKKTEKIYADILKILSNNKDTNREIKNHLLSLKSYHDYFIESQDWLEYFYKYHDWFDYFMDLIINSYNNYYLHDDNYYNGYWRRDYWVWGEGDKFYDGYPRILKTKMNEQNIKHLFEKNCDIYQYLWCMEQHSSFPPNIEEQIYLDMIKLLKNKKYNMEEIKNHILSVSLYSDHLLDPEYDYQFNIRNENWFNYFIAIIINNYHTYYLNDKFYFKGYWYDNAWIKDDDKDYYDGYPYQYSW